MSTRSIALARERRNILANELNNDWGDHLDGHFSAFWERINADHEQADPVARARIERAVQKLGPTIEALTERLYGGSGSDGDCDALYNLLCELDASVVAAVTGESFKEREIPLEITRSLQFPFSLTLYCKEQDLTDLVETVDAWLANAGVKQATLEVRYGEEFIQRKDYNTNTNS